MKFKHITLAALIMSGSAQAQTIDVGTDATNYTNWSVSERFDRKILTAQPVFIPINDWGNVPAITIPSTMKYWKSNPGFWVAQTTFTLPSDATNVELSITQLGVDDRAVIELNGVPITSVGTTSNGEGFMQLTMPGKNEPYDFQFIAGAVNFTETENFQAGVNTITVIVNNTGHGIDGHIERITPGNPTNFGMVAQVSYDEP